MKKRFGLLVTVVLLVLSPIAYGQDFQSESPPASDVPPPNSLLEGASKFIKSNHLHQISGFSTLLLAGSTGVAGIAMASGLDLPGGWVAHKALAAGTILAGATTLGLGLAAYSSRLDEVWPHAALMTLAEIGWIASISFADTESGPNPQGVLIHRVSEAVSTTSLLAGLAAIILLTSN